jgi:hypothetical protein
VERGSSHGQKQARANLKLLPANVKSIEPLRQLISFMFNRSGNDVKEIIEGFLKFQKEVFPQRAELFKKLSHAQAPTALFVTCSDSRFVPEMVTQREPGDIFVIRNAGNIVPAYGGDPEAFRPPSNTLLQCWVSPMSSCVWSL